MTALLDHLLAPLARFLDDPAVEDICVQMPQEVWVFRRGSYTQHSIPELDTNAIEDIAIIAAAQRHQDISQDLPLLSTDLSGRGRLQAIFHPCVPEGKPCLSIRRGSDIWPTLDKLGAAGLFALTKPFRDNEKDADLTAHYQAGRWEEFFKTATALGKTILGCGLTGSGKSHFAKACLAGLPTTSRVVTIEDTPELNGIQEHLPNSVQLLYDKSGNGVAASDLVEASLRMRPDHLVLHEIRDGQAALAFILALQTGHRGITTIHANHCAAAFDRLRFIIKQTPGGAAIPGDDLMSQLRELVDIVVHLGRDGSKFYIDEVLFAQ